MSISSAPSIISSSFGAPATATDPYPGFVKNEQGTWIAKDQETYNLYLESIQKAEQSKLAALPKGFDERAMNASGMLEVDAGARARETRPVQAPRPGSEAYELAKPKMVRPHRR